MHKRNKVCIYMFIAVMLLQIIIPVLSVILETRYSSTSEAVVPSVIWNDIGKGADRTSAVLNLNTGELTITKNSGSGSIKDFEENDSTKWEKNGISYANQIKSIKIGEGIKYIGKYAFNSLENLQKVSGDYAKNVADGAFKNWTKQCMTTYLDLFIRLAIIYFIITISTQIREAVENTESVLFSSTGLETGSCTLFWVKIFLIIGL